MASTLKLTTKRTSPSVPTEELYSIGETEITYEELQVLLAGGIVKEDATKRYFTLTIKVPNEGQAVFHELKSQGWRLHYDGDTRSGMRPFRIKKTELYNWKTSVLSKVQNTGYLFLCMYSDIRISDTCDQDAEEWLQALRIE